MTTQPQLLATEPYKGRPNLQWNRPLEDGENLAQALTEASTAARFAKRKAPYRHLFALTAITINEHTLTLQFHAKGLRAMRLKKFDPRFDDLKPQSDHKHADKPCLIVATYCEPVQEEPEPVTTEPATSPKPEKSTQIPDPDYTPSPQEATVEQAMPGDPTSPDFWEQLQEVKGLKRFHILRGECARLGLDCTGTSADLEVRIQDRQARDTPEEPTS